MKRKLAISLAVFMSLSNCVLGIEKNSSFSCFNCYDDVCCEFGRYSPFPIYKIRDKRKFQKFMLELPDDITWKFFVDGKYHMFGDPYIFDKDREEDDYLFKGEKNWLSNTSKGFKYLYENVDCFNSGLFLNNFEKGKYYNNFYLNLHRLVCPEKPDYDNRTSVGIVEVNGNFIGILEFFIQSCKINNLTYGWSNYLKFFEREQPSKMHIKELELYLNGKINLVSMRMPGISTIKKINGKTVSENLVGDMINSTLNKISNLSINAEYKLGYDFQEYKNAYNCLQEKIQKVFPEAKLDERILEYNIDYLKKIECSKDEAIIAEIVSLCQSLDRGHFFRDGNTRTAYLFLNFLLVNYGFLPTILDDPNKLEFYDIKSLVREVIEGQQKVLDLLSII